MSKDPCRAFTPLTDCSFLLDERASILSVRQNSSPTGVTPTELASAYWIGRSYYDFCTGTASTIVRTQLENLVAGKIRHFATVYDCAADGNDIVPFALIATVIEPHTQSRFRLCHVAMNYSWPDLDADTSERQRVAFLLKQFFEDPTKHSWSLLSDQPALQVLEHLFASLERVRASMDEAAKYQDNGVTHRRLAQLLVQIASVTDAVFSEISGSPTCTN